MKSNVKLWLRIYLSFFKVGALTFGGGYSMLPILEHEVITNKKWIEKQEMLDYFAISQTLPGIIAVNVATFIGSKLAGFVGSVFAALGVVTPSIIVISIIAAFLSNFTDIPAVQRVMAGMNIAVAALLVQAVFSMAKGVEKDPITVTLAIAAFIAVAFFNVSSVIILLAAVVVSLIVKKRRGEL
ncbi:chromate transporter [Ruminococcaceae bacterium OttesenSCG-928-L11]|nr:chromate transporter [Ruminococcaceae bacterium OttesenSCG-928-L11]